ncbi:hypothetical protein BJ875DRAFT_461204 [Amylocarpus encephaloides]|uniref:Zn(2)-C6 fungal-type domain-containing protein n=1 Tax=Amylocarpus encephaloides TaxID=45428 RepID=A0A9P7YJ89_9HELO|nr:hypothetical protein BJ875DRAFT_461204 [Amylocarpus encephaloides]
MSPFADPSSPRPDPSSALDRGNTPRSASDTMSPNQEASVSPASDESQSEVNFSEPSSREKSPDTPPTPLEPQFDDFHDPNAMSVDESESESDSEDEECLDYGPSAPQELGDDSLLRMRELKRSVISSWTRYLAIQHNDHRKVVTTKRGLATAYIDRDDSGNYNPKPLRTVPLKRKRASTARGQNDETDKCANERRKWGRNRTRMTFHFTNSTAIEYLKSISTQEIDKAPGKALLGPKRNNPGEDKKRKLRQKGPLAVKRDDGLTLETLSEGHPQRRGCKSCFHLGDNGCSLIDCGDDWPCIQCEESGIDCQLIVPPPLKLVCILCKFKKIQCSYERDGGFGVERCTSCEKTNDTCCAGRLEVNSILGKIFLSGEMVEPLESATRSLPASSSAEPSEDSFNGPKVCKPKTNLKVKVGVARSLASKSNKTIIRKPKKFYTIPSPGTSSGERRHVDSKKQRKHKQLEATKPQGRRPRSGFPVTARLPFTDNIQHININTSFAHPITLNHVAPADGSDPCSWCTSPFFGIWGHGQTTVEVIPYGGDIGHIEVPGTGGHLEAGKPPSKMCLSCTFERCRISKCKCHEVTRLEEIEEEGFDADKFSKSLVTLRAGDIDLGGIALRTKWCSICASPAVSSCSRPQPFSVDGIMNPSPTQPTANPAFKGCGLHLCVICEWTLQRISSSQSVARKTIVDSLVEVRNRELWKYEGGEIRADSSFLMAGGELMVRLKDIARGNGMGVA